MQSHIGFIGDKVTLELTCKKMVQSARPKLYQGDIGIEYLHICVDQFGNDVLYRGVARGFPLQGETRRITCRVAKHRMFLGCPQTIINRPRLAKVEKQ